MRANNNKIGNVDGAERRSRKTDDEGLTMEITMTL